MTAPAAALAQFAALSTVQLVEVFEGTNGNNDASIPTVRGWIMDELETRNPEAFLAWLEATPPTDSPRPFFA